MFARHAAVSSQYQGMSLLWHVVCWIVLAPHIDVVSHFGIVEAFHLAPSTIVFLPHRCTGRNNSKHVNEHTHIRKCQWRLPYFLNTTHQISNQQCVRKQIRLKVNAEAGARALADLEQTRAALQKARAGSSPTVSNGWRRCWRNLQGWSIEQQCKSIWILPSPSW